MTIESLRPTDSMTEEPVVFANGTSNKRRIDMDHETAVKHKAPMHSVLESETADPLYSQFSGWMGLDAESVNGNLKLQCFKPKKWEETDVDIKITHCGLCGSDLHALRSGWDPTPYPCCAGHEIIGTVLRVGSKVRKPIKVGDRIGSGPVVWQCRQPSCPECSAGMSNYCSLRVPAYGGTFPNGDATYGGFANYCRVPGDSTIRIPDSLPSAAAAPMLCAGITAFVPLSEHGAGPGKRVGVIGVGGLGHFAILFAKALKCERVVAISRHETKRVDALQLGADEYIATAAEPDWADRHAGSLDLIVSTVSSADMPLNDYLRLLRTKGCFCQVGMPEEPMPRLDVAPLVMSGISIGFNDIGTVEEVEEMLEFAGREGIRPWVQERRMQDVNEVLREMSEGKARYRYVLVNED